MGEIIPWRMKTIPHGGHMAPLAHPELVNPLIADFLGHRGD